jgi:S-adenosylmethionine synthetase
VIENERNWAPGAQEEIQTAVRNVVREIGYEQDGFHWQNLHFENHLHGQSSHIAQGVDATGNKDEGAGDQGIMFGYRLRRNAGPDARDALLQPQDPGEAWRRTAIPARPPSWSPTPRAR